MFFVIIFDLCDDNVFSALRSFIAKFVQLFHLFCCNWHFFRNEIVFDFITNFRNFANNCITSQSKKHQFQIILIRKNFQKNWFRWNQLKIVKIIKFDHELIVLLKHFYSFFFHTTREKNALKKNKQISKSFSLVT